MRPHGTVDGTFGPRFDVKAMVGQSIGDSQNETSVAYAISVAPIGVAMDEIAYPR